LLGIIFAKNSTLILEEVSVSDINNNCNSLFCLENSSFIQIYNSSIYNCSIYGYLINLSENTTLYANGFSIKNSTFSKKSDAFGGILYLSFNSTFEYSFFKNLILNETSLITFENGPSSFFLKYVSFAFIFNNNLSEKPLILLVNNTYLEAEIIFCKFENNFVFSNLIFINNNLGLLTFNSSSFSSNYALDTIYCEQSLGLKFFQCDFNNQNNNISLVNENSFAPLLGSCLYIENSYIKYFYNFTISNSLSYTDSFGVKIIDDENEISALKMKLNMSDDTNITIIYSTLVNNYLYYQGNLVNIGGAFYFSTCLDVYFEATLFSYNIMNCTSNALKQVGGACITFIDGKSLNIKDCWFKNNSARFQSSCIFFTGNSLLINSSAFYYHSPIIDQQTKEDYLETEMIYDLLNILGFIENSRGGAIYSAGQLNTIEGSYFEGNEASYGGSLFLDELQLSSFNELIIDESLFINEQAGLYGASMYFTAEINCLMGNITNSKIINSLAEMSAIFLDSLPYLSNFTFNNLVFYNNTAEYGAALFLHQISGTAILTNSQFYENQALELQEKPVCGGAIAIWGDFRNVLIASGNIYINNLAGKFGGVNSFLGAAIQSTNETFFNSMALLKGGAIILYSQAQLNLSNSIIRNSSSVSSGGAFTLSDMTILMLENVTIENSSSLLLGGVFELSERSFVFALNCKIINAESVSGGLVNIWDCLNQTSTFINCTFESATASDALFSLTGGTIYFTNCVFSNQSSNFIWLQQANLFFEKTVIQNSYYPMDNFIYVSEESVLILLDVLFKNSTGEKENNLFISIQNSELQIMNTIFWNTIYELSLSLILGENSFIQMNNSLFMNFSSSCFVLSNTTFYINDSFFYNDPPATNYYSIGSIIQINSANYSYLQNCLFANFNSLSNGTGMKLSNANNSNFENIMIISCKFIQLTTSQNGGALHILQANVEIIESYFIYNSAAKYGGAINSETSFTLNLTAFYSNNAELGGGAIFWGFQKPSSNSIDYQNNTSAYGPNEASSLIKISIQIFNSTTINNQSLIYDSDQSTFDIENVIQGQQSGGDFLYTIMFIYLDWYDQIMTSLNNLIETIELIDEEELNLLLYGIQRTNQSHTFLFGPNNFLIQKGVLLVNNIKIISNPNTTIYMKMASSIYDIIALNLRTDVQNFEFITLNSLFILIPIKIRPCISGEIFKSEDYICDECGPLTFSYNPTDNSCSSCLENSQCLGGNVVVVDSGFWRSSNTSLNVYSCQENSDNCQGGDAPCLNNFQGPLCRTCLSGFYEIDDNSCIECQSMVWNYIRIAGFIIVLFVLVIFLIKSSLDNNQLLGKLKEETKEGIAVSSRFLMKNIDLQSLYMKIVVNYFQFLSLLNDVPVTITVPDFINSFFGFLSYFNSISTKFIGFECIFNTGGFQSIIQFTRVICVNLTALILVLLSIIFWKILKIFKKCQNITDKIIMTFIGIYLMLQSNILNEFTNVLICTQIDDKTVIRNEPMYECKGDFYSKMYYFFFWPGFMFWAYFIPFFVLFALFWNKDKLYELSFYQKMNFFYTGYREKYYYWDILIFLRKSIVITLSIMAPDPLFKLIIALVVIGIYFNYQITKRPFLTKDLNLLEFSSNLIIILTIYLCIILFVVDNMVLQFLILIATFMINVGYLVLWLIFYVKYMRKIYKPLAKKIFSLISNHAKMIITATSRFQIGKHLKSPQASLKSLKPKKGNVSPLQVKKVLII